MTFAGILSLVLAVFFYTDGHFPIGANTNEMAFLKMEGLETSIKTQQFEYAVYLIKTFFSKLLSI